MRKRIFYGWWIVAAGMAIMATEIGIINNCFGLFVVPACEELGLSRQAMGTTQTMLSLGCMLVALFSGVIFTRVNLRRLMCVSAVVMCLCYALFSAARTLWQFYLIALVVAIAQAMINVVPFSIILGNWFCEKRGLAIGLTFMGSGVGGMVFNVIGGQLVVSVGWRATVLVFTAILCAVILPLMFFVIRTHPADKGLEPLGADSAERAQQSEGPGAGMTLREALRTGRFYILVLDIAVAGLAVNAIATTSTPFYTDVFHSETIGANLASGFMASLAIGKFALGGLYDRLGALRATLLARVLLVVALFSLAQGTSVAFIVAFLACCGLSCASSSVSIPILARAAFGVRDVAAITGIFSAAQSFGGLFAPAGCGMVCDMTGSYAPSYLILCAAVVVMIPPMVFALRKKRADGASGDFTIEKNLRPK